VLALFWVQHPVAICHCFYKRFVELPPGRVLKRSTTLVGCRISIIAVTQFRSPPRFTSGRQRSQHDWLALKGDQHVAQSVASPTRLAARTRDTLRAHNRGRRPRRRELESFYTTDPGKALISGLCSDFNRGKGPILRGLAARAPYFHNGAAANLDELVNFYNQRFQMNLTEEQKKDLVAFLNSL
jgi:hypothetical protein